MFWNRKTDTSPLGIPLGQLKELLEPTTIKPSIKGNVLHAYDDGSGNNKWNELYPIGGNYWDDWTTPDIKYGPSQDKDGSDGIVDEPRRIDPGKCEDIYPVTIPNGWDDTGAKLETTQSAIYENEQLIIILDGMDIQKGLKNSLEKKLEGSLDKLNTAVEEIQNGNDNYADNKQSWW